MNKTSKNLTNEFVTTKEIKQTTNELINPLQNVSNRKRIPRIYLYFIYFLIFSIIGWLLETAFSFYALGHFTKRGFLYGPLCPIYGWGALILIMFFSTYKRKHNLKLFFYAAIIFSIFEYLVSFGMESLFSLKWWDYTKEVLNLNGRISIFYSFAWGIIALLFINFVYPFFKKKVNTVLSKIPYKLQIVAIYILLIAFITDTVFSCIRYLIQ